MIGLARQQPGTKQPIFEDTTHSLQPEQTWISILVERLHTIHEQIVLFKKERKLKETTKLIDSQREILKIISPRQKVAVYYQFHLCYSLDIS